QHPTQALLDVYTMREELGRIEGLHVAIVGDVLHSRVARSLIQALTLMGAHVTLVAPPALLPRGVEAMGCETSTDIAAIAAADVVYVLRMQRERMQEGANYVPSLREYTARWGVTPERLRPGQKVMHPGPMNRGVEIDPRVADAAAALIETQVRAGLAVRMAGLYHPVTTRPRRWGWPDAVRQVGAGPGPRRARRARARPGRGTGRGLRRAGRPRRRRPDRDRPGRQRPPGGRGRGPRACARLRRPARAPARAGRGGRGDD